MIDDADLWTQLRIVLAQLELCSSAPTTSYNPDGTASESSADLPTVNPPHLRYRQRLTGVAQGLQRRLDAAEAEGNHNQRHAEQAKAHDWAHQARVQILKDARAELKHLTGRDGQPPARRTAELDTTTGIEHVIREEAAGKPADTLAAKLNISIFIVRRIYIAEGLDPHDGTPIGDGNSPRERALQMRDRFTIRQIALILKVPKSTVHDWLRHAA
jgi:hypothetical protein